MRAGRKARGPLHRDADAQPARPSCGCAGRHIRTAGLLRFAPPGPGSPFRRPPPVVRRRDRQAGGSGCARHGRAPNLLASVRAATSPGCRRAACTPVARLCRGILPAARVGCVARFAPDAGGRSGARSALSVAATAARGWGCRVCGGRRSFRVGHETPERRGSANFTGTPTRSHLPARPWRGCAGAGSGWQGWVA
jgi:hypothetical protein